MRMEQLEKELKDLQDKKTKLEQELFESQRVLARNQESLNRLQYEADKDAREEAAKNGWFEYIASTLMRKPAETPEEKEVRQRRGIDRQAAQRIKREETNRHKVNINRLWTQISSIETEISRVQGTKSYEEQQERRRQQEAIRREQMERWRKEAEKAKAEEERRREEQRKSEERQKAEAGRRRKEAEKAKAEEERRREEQRKNEERQKSEAGRRRRAERTAKPSPISCSHRYWWDRVEGRHTCSRCQQKRFHFAFKCPGCQMIACTECRDALKGTRRTRTPNFMFDD
jgi:hypothetical protein